MSTQPTTSSSTLQSKLVGSYNSLHFVDGEWREQKSPFDNSPLPDSLNVATYNVLFGAPSYIPVKGITRDDSRFRHQSEHLIPNTQPDVLGLNEVVPPLVEHLRASSFVRGAYNISAIGMSGENRVHYLLVLAKRPFRVFDIEVRGQTETRIQVALFAAEGDTTRAFMAVVCHLDAYEGRAQKRQNQLADLGRFFAFGRGSFDDLLGSISDSGAIIAAAKGALRHRNVILMGDMNLHFPNETMYLYENGFLDAWIEWRHSAHERVTTEEDINGYTWDAQKNVMCKLMLPFDNRRMRLDRITLLKDASLFARVDDMRVLAKERIGVSLSASDHFMLTANIALAPARISGRGGEDQTAPKYEQKVPLDRVRALCASQRHGFRPIAAVVALRVASSVAVVGVVLALAVKVLF